MRSGHTTPESMCSVAQEAHGRVGQDGQRYAEHNYRGRLTVPSPCSVLIAVRGGGGHPIRFVPRCTIGSVRTETLSVERAAWLLGIARSTAYRLAEVGTLPVFAYQCRRESEEAREAERANLTIWRQHLDGEPPAWMVERLRELNEGPPREPIRALVDPVALVGFAARLIGLGEMQAEASRQKAGGPSRARVVNAPLDVASAQPWLLTIDHAAAQLGCSRVGVYRRHRDGRIVIVHVGGARNRCPRVPAASLDAYREAVRAAAQSNRPAQVDWASRQLRSDPRHGNHRAGCSLTTA